MELLKGIIMKIIDEDDSIVVIDSNIADKFYFRCYTALNSIRNIIADDTLSDFECVEKIVYVFERFGSDGGGRHAL